MPLPAGKTKRVRLQLGFEKLSIWNLDMNQTVEHGNVRLMAVESSNRFIIMMIL
ncbi:fibronectin type III-like domain-contianing protein [Gracilibacillus dipsosauri]|uniref:fibronectin type III-like domain-contianing protein n=1 Tax=Gracilibacillus dipsosauri TaxID=178340 RepID=UPI003CCC7179